MDKAIKKRLLLILNDFLSKFPNFDVYLTHYISNEPDNTWILIL